MLTSNACAYGATRRLPIVSVIAVVTPSVNEAWFKSSAGVTVTTFAFAASVAAIARPSEWVSRIDALVTVDASGGSEKWMVRTFVLRSNAAATTRGPEQSMRA
jgi:hypothetical protein